MEAQRLIDDRTRSCSSGGYSGMPQTMGESSQATQTDLQDLLQMLSQITKQMHDTAQAIVRNMG
jgi:hypothetical protein